MNHNFHRLPPALLGAALPGAAVGVEEADSPAAREARARLVAEVAASGAVTDSRVLAALGDVPRHWFVDAPLTEAYQDRPLSIGHQQTISQPLIVGMMTEALALEGGERVLEIGTGSGYQAAVLARMGARVYSIEIVPELYRTARTRLRRHGVHGIALRLGDGYRGWPEMAPFDRILLTAAPPDLPAALLGQLRVGGILIAPIGVGEHQRLGRWIKTAGGLRGEDLGPVRFVPMVHQP
jgi:protein-L-isoaspartate(D-aspartate) O-methyltransferase